MVVMVSPPLGMAVDVVRRYLLLLKGFFLMIISLRFTPTETMHALVPVRSSMRLIYARAALGSLPNSVTPDVSDCHPFITSYSGSH